MEEIKIEGYEEVPVIEYDSLPWDQKKTVKIQTGMKEEYKYFKKKEVWPKEIMLTYNYRLEINKDGGVKLFCGNSCLILITSSDFEKPDNQEIDIKAIEEMLKIVKEIRSKK